MNTLTNLRRPVLMRVRSLILAALAATLAVALSSCAVAPPAVGTVVDKDVNEAHEVSGTCSGDGVTTPLICTSDTEVPAEYFVRVERTDGRFVLVQVDADTYQSTKVGDHFDETALDYHPTTWEQVEYQPGKWATKA